MFHWCWQRDAGMLENPFKVSPPWCIGANKSRVSFIKTVYAQNWALNIYATIKTSWTGECSNLYVHSDPFWRWKNIDANDRVMRQHIMWAQRKAQGKRFVFTPVINHRSALCIRWIKPECHIQFTLKGRFTCTWWIIIQTVILLFAVVLGQETLCPSSVSLIWLYMSKFINIYQSLMWICVSWKLIILLSFSRFKFTIILRKKNKSSNSTPFRSWNQRLVKYYLIIKTLLSVY